MPAAAARTVAVEEAPVCDVMPTVTIIPAGETFTQIQAGGRFGKEIFTTVTIEKDGQAVARGPCPLLVPVIGADTNRVILSPVAVATTDASGDGLCQPGEDWCDYRITVTNVGDVECVDPVATLSSPPDQFNLNEVVFLNSVSSYSSWPEYPGDGLPLEENTNHVAFSLTTTEGQLSDVGRAFLLSVDCANLQDAVEMPLVLGLGGVCDPVTGIDGESYDHIDGLHPPVAAALVPQGSPVNFSDRNFNHGSTIPMKLSLSCGGQPLDDESINPNPQIVTLVHETLGPQSLIGINGDNNANPDDPGFSCGSTTCDYQFRTEDLPVGTYVIGIKLPDSRIFEAGFTIRP